MSMGWVWTFLDSWIAVCPKCKGVFFYGDTRVCPWCGFNIERAYCEKCKRDWNKEFNYCPICGCELVKVNLYPYVSDWKDDTEWSNNNTWDWQGWSYNG